MRRLASSSNTDTYTKLKKLADDFLPKFAYCKEQILKQLRMIPAW